MKKKILSLLLSVVMLAGMMITSVSAADATLYEEALNKSLAVNDSDSTIPWGCAFWGDSYTAYNSTESLLELKYQYMRGTGGRRYSLYYLKESFLPDKNIPSGSIVEYQFKAKNATADVEFMPVGFFADTKGNGYAIRTVYIKNNALYAVKTNSASNGVQASFANGTDVKICDITDDVWYTVKIRVNYDDSASTDATYNAYITDGSNEYRILENYLLGVPAVDWNTMQRGLTNISTVIIGGANGQDSTELKTDSGSGYPVAGGVFMRNLKIYTTDFAEEFTTRIFENSGTLPALSDSGNEGFYWKGSWTDGYKPTAITTEDGRTAVQMPGKASISSGSNIPNWRTTTALGNGNYVVEGTFKMVNQMAQYYPITFHTDLTTNVNRQIKTVWAEGGKLWAKAADAPNSLSEIYSPGKIEICSLDSTKWYDIKISVNCDGDASTVDTYSYSITDGTNSYTGGPYAFGQAMNDSQQGQYDATSIVSVGFGTCGKANDVEGLTYIDRLAAYAQDSMEVAANKSNLDGVSITFDEAINPRSLTSVSLYKTKEESTKIPAVFSLSADGKTLNVNAEGLDFSSEYTVKIPKNVVSVNNKSLADVYETAFSTGNAAIAAEISNATYSGTLTSGSTVNITADCKNTAGVKAQIKLCAQVQDSEGNVLGSAYTDSVYKDGETKNFKVSLKVPEGAAKIDLYATAANGDPITSYVIK